MRKILRHYFPVQTRCKNKLSIEICFKLGRSHTSTNNEHVLCARHYSKCSTCIIAFHPHHGPTAQMHTMGYKKAQEPAPSGTVSKWRIQLLSSGQCSQLFNSLSKLSSGRKWGLILLGTSWFVEFKDSSFSLVPSHYPTAHNSPRVIQTDVLST